MHLGRFVNFFPYRRHIAILVLEFGNPLTIQTHLGRFFIFFPNTLEFPMEEKLLKWPSY